MPERDTKRGAPPSAAAQPTPPPSSGGSSTRQPLGDEDRTRPKTNRLYLVFSCLSLTVALININFHHAFHAEHVIDSTRRDFKGKFRLSRKETDDYVTKRLWDEDAEAANAAQHKLAGLKCTEKYGGPDDEYAEREMAFWSDIPVSQLEVYRFVST